MMLTEETSIPAGALPLDAFKQHLRLGTGFAEDDLQDAVLESFLRAAIASIEARTGKVLLQRDFSWKLNMWRDARGQVLPVAPVVAIMAVTATNRAGEDSVLEPDTYRLEQDAQRPRLMPAGFILPTIPLDGSVTVRMTAGMAQDWAGVPTDLAQAVMLLAAHYYEFRHETQLGQGCMPFGVTSLIAHYKPVRLGGRGVA